MSFGMIPLSPDDKPDGFVLLSMYEKLESENAKLRDELADAPKCETCEAMLDCDECLRADCSHKERRRLSVENERLRELVDYMTPIAWYEASERERDRMRELGVEVDDGSR